jgi:hypothetical protein
MGWAYGLGGEGGEEDDANRAPVRWGEVRVGAGPPGNRATGLLGVVVGKGGHLNPVI